jgi:hypothetical protein
MTNSTAPAITTTVSVCTTCHLAAAGYSSEEMGYEPTVEPWALWDGEPGTAIAEGQEGYFSSSSCDGCGDTFAGDRFDDTWLLV